MTNLTNEDRRAIRELILRTMLECFLINKQEDETLQATVTRQLDQQIMDRKYAEERNV